ncbi:conserved hypothetical protein [uncultured Alphaproteobacteria bacterium]|uniref:Uncharacterized protein n=1 Tax=uncultured Alphaproteobacteria bacterium TaxID=91750 RepID=A0A212KDH2_9PROT|nr:conserved hypothetical protein [uncultured Alphaproteobacteria bacterium]
MALLHVVHCIDTEGPLTETLEASFERLRGNFGIDLPPDADTLARLQRREIPLDGREEAVARMLAPELLAYNSSWQEIDAMLVELLSPAFRDRMRGDDGKGWVYSWHCMDHMRYGENPRHKDVGYGNVFRFYRAALRRHGVGQDEINWHFHPLSLTRNPLHAATSFANSQDVLLEIIARRILEDAWFPVVNRPGFHAERPDSHLFLEQWLPFDYANQAHENETDQPDLSGGRFGDWRRAPRSWRGYRPSHDDHQVPGDCRRWIFRCLNVGTRFRALTADHVREAFREAGETGTAILAFADHDYRDIRRDVAAVRALLAAVRSEFPGVELRFSGAEAAARDLLGIADHPAPRLSLRIEDNRAVVRVEAGAIFGPQPFLALRSRDGRTLHDNLDVQEPGRLWTYCLDDQTLPPEALAAIGVGTAGRWGGFATAKLEMLR